MLSARTLLHAYSKGGKSQGRRQGRARGKKPEEGRKEGGVYFESGKHISILLTTNCSRLRETPEHWLGKGNHAGREEGRREGRREGGKEDVKRLPRSRRRGGIVLGDGEVDEVVLLVV